ncbi:MAG: T9SS type A sorting domain-containing protein [Flavobacteriales bacterium]|nr:T9SS type A sorting domain-containing protein [Flavobacteriales bacterium]
MKRTLFGFCAGCIAASAMSQCGPCAISDTCTVDPPFPTVCPAITPIGTVGVPYDLDVTFWIPPSFAEPTTQLNVVLQEVTLVSMENVPLGLTYEASSPTLIYYPQVDPFGCVRVCGVPMVAGNDTIQLTAVAQGTVGGIAINQNYSLGIPIQVLPAPQDTVADFTSAPDSLCAPMTVAFSEAVGAAGMTTTFTWDFGNGTSFSGSAPPEQTYTEGGQYPVSLQRAFSVPMLTQVSVSGVSNSWCGDLDEPNLPIVGCVGQPDLYFTVQDSRLAIWRSSTLNNVQSTTWNNLSIPLGFPPFTLRIYDQDELSDDDLLGNFIITSATGSASFSQGGTNGTRQVEVQTVLITTYSDTVHVLGNPVFTLAYDEVTGTVCATDQSLGTYAWSLDGLLVEGQTGPCVPASNGLWSLLGTTVEGCSGSAQLLLSGVGINEVDTGLRLQLHPVPSSGAVTLIASVGGIADITVLDPGGRVVHAERRAQLGEKGAVLDLAHLGAGYYLVRVEVDGTSSTVRLMLAPH